MATAESTAVAATNTAPSVISFPPITTTLELAPMRDLQNEAIEDRPARPVRAVTDGTIKYKMALWAPQSEWIAAVPQDGPGMDIINSVTGEVVPVVTDTYVLEPVWDADAADADRLLVHRIVDGRDQLDLFSVQTRGFITTPITADTPLRALSLMGDTVFYAQDGQLVQQTFAPQAAAQQLTAGGALVTTPTARGLIAWTPPVSDFEDVQTFVAAINDPQPAALSTLGEGWWLPRWAPDGSKLVLSNIEGRIGSTSIDGAQRFDLGPGIEPTWSPDSSRIAFAGQGAGSAYTTRDIFVVDWQGNGPRLRLTRANDEQIYAAPSWSPDGSRLAFVEIDSGQIFVADAPTS